MDEMFVLKYIRTYSKQLQIIILIMTLAWQENSFAVYRAITFVLQPLTFDGPNR